MKPKSEINDNSEELQKKKVKMEEEKTSPGNEVFGSFQKKKNQDDTERRNKFKASPFSCTITQYHRLSSSIVVHYPVPSSIIQYRHTSSGIGTLLLLSSTIPILINNLIFDIQNSMTVLGTGCWHWMTVS